MIRMIRQEKELDVYMDIGIKKEVSKMSVSLYRWTEECNTDWCCGDCDECDRYFEEEEEDEDD